MDIWDRQAMRENEFYRVLRAMVEDAAFCAGKEDKLDLCNVDELADEFGIDYREIDNEIISEEI